MPFRCASCNLTFESAEEFMAHKRNHKKVSTAKPEGQGLLCLKCGKPIPLSISQANYRGAITCLTCGQTMRVRMEGGEVVFAVAGQD